MTHFKFLFIALSLVVAGLINAEAVGAPSIKLAITFPKNSAGEKLSGGLPSSTKISPCSDIAKMDAATFTLTYDATNPLSTKTAPLTPLDVYLFFYNPDTVDGTNKFYSVNQDLLRRVVNVDAYLDADAVKSAKLAGTLAPYLSGLDNYNNGSMTEILFGTAIRLDALASQSTSTGLSTGTWQLIGILSDANFDFTNPSTWLAWDVATMMFGMPWHGNVSSAVTTKTCQ
ncbi:MAG: hypothetical protein PHH11_17385 [Methylomonas sp.]|nr:hypothetical protein [Methylomonas sp.]